MSLRGLFTESWLFNIEVILNPLDFKFLGFCALLLMTDVVCFEFLDSKWRISAS